jgi:hypothetical protein
MSEQRIRQRTADVRTTWSFHERRQRALASERRCRELLTRIGLATWQTAPAVSDKRGPLFNC